MEGSPLPTVIEQPEIQEERRGAEEDMQIPQNIHLGDEESEIAPGTLFEKLPEDWVCPECSEAKDQFIEA